MKTAAIPGYRLARAKKSTRILTTLGLLGLFLGLLSAALLTITKTGLAPSSVRAYYLGSDLVDGVSTGDSGGEISELLSGSSPRPFAELAEVTHLHLVGCSMLLFFLCHLLSVCDLEDSTRSVLYLVAFISFILTFALPWLIIYVAPEFSYLFGASVTIFLLSLFALTIIPIREMWVVTDTL